MGCGDRHVWGRRIVVGNLIVSFFTLLWRCRARLEARWIFPRAIAAFMHLHEPAAAAVGICRPGPALILEVVAGCVASGGLAPVSKRCACQLGNSRSYNFRIANACAIGGAIHGGGIANIPQSIPVHVTLVGI